MQPKIESIINEMLSPVIKHCGPVRSKREGLSRGLTQTQEETDEQACGFIQNDDLS